MNLDCLHCVDHLCVKHLQSVKKLIIMKGRGLIAVVKVKKKEIFYFLR
jgi:hypothetical protein